MKISLPLIIGGFLAVYFSAVYVFFYLKKSNKKTAGGKNSNGEDEEPPINNSNNSKFMKPSKASSVGIAPNDVLTEADLEKILGRFQKSNGEKLVQVPSGINSTQEEENTKGQVMPEMEAKLDGTFTNSEESEDPGAEAEEIIDFDESETYFGEFDEIDYGFNGTYVTFNSAGNYSLLPANTSTLQADKDSAESTINPFLEIQSLPLDNAIKPELIFSESEEAPIVSINSLVNETIKSNSDQINSEVKNSLLLSETESNPDKAKTVERPLVKILSPREQVKHVPKSAGLEKVDFFSTQFKKSLFLPLSKELQQINEAVYAPERPQRRSLERMSISGSVFKSFNLINDDEELPV